MDKPTEKDIQKGLDNLSKVGEAPSEKAMDLDDEMEKALAKYTEDFEKAMPENLKEYVAKKRSKTDKDEVKKAIPTAPDFQAVVEKAVADSQDAIVEKVKEALSAQFNELLAQDKAGHELVSKALDAFNGAAERTVTADETLKGLRAEIQALKDAPTERLSIGSMTQKGIEQSKVAPEYDFNHLAVIAAQHWGGNPSRALNFAEVAKKQSVEKALSAFPDFPKNKLKEAVTGVN